MYFCRLNAKNKYATRRRKEIKMDKYNNDNKKDVKKDPKKNGKVALDKNGYLKDKEIDPIDGRYGNNDTNAVPGINTPGIELPAFNPPVPNRAWTAMRAGLDIDELSEEEKRELYYGKDAIF